MCGPASLAVARRRPLPKDSRPHSDSRLAQGYQYPLNWWKGNGFHDAARHGAIAAALRW
jgi:hypothetical protein